MTALTIMMIRLVCQVLSVLVVLVVARPKKGGGGGGNFNDFNGMTAAELLKSVNEIAVSVTESCEIVSCGVQNCDRVCISFSV